MRVKLSFLMLLALMIASSNVFANSYSESTYKTMIQKAIGGYQQGPTTAGVYTLLAGQGQSITGVLVSAGATAGFVSIFDANSTNIGGTTTAGGQAGPLEAVFETQVAANTMSFINLNTAPIGTTYGVVICTTGTAGAVVYTGPGTAN